MLVLMRRVGERIVIGENIVVELCSSRLGQAKIGVYAPREVRIDREEIRHGKDLAQRHGGAGHGGP